MFGDFMSDTNNNHNNEDVATGILIMILDRQESIEESKCKQKPRLTESRIC